MIFTSDYTFLVDGLMQFGEWCGPTRPKDASQVTETSHLIANPDNTSYLTGTVDDPND